MSEPERQLTITMQKRIQRGSHSVAVQKTAANQSGKGQAEMEMIAIYEVNNECRQSH